MSIQEISPFFLSSLGFIEFFLTTPMLPPIGKAQLPYFFSRESLWKKPGRNLCITTLIDQSISQPSSGKHLHVIDVINLGTLNWPIYKEENKRPWETDCGVLSPKCDVYIIRQGSPQSPGILMEEEAGR